MTVQFHYLEFLKSTKCWFLLIGTLLLYMLYVNTAVPGSVGGNGDNNGILNVVWKKGEFTKKRATTVSPINMNSPGDRSIEIVFVEDNFEQMDQDDPRLIRYVRSRYLTRPSGKPRNLKNPNDYQRTPLAQWVRRFYKDKRDGIFLEAGANDGESSNTVMLEIELGWTGLLIECNPKVTPFLRNANRNAWTAEVCLSTTEHPAVINMSVPETWDYSARIGPAWDLSKFGVNSNWTYFDGVESVPLYPILKASGWTEFDYFSFDIEGNEFAVLKAFPFGDVLFKVLITEVYFLNNEQKLDLKTFLRSKGLIFARSIEMDYIFVHESELKLRNLTESELAKL